MTSAPPLYLVDAGAGHPGVKAIVGAFACGTCGLAMVRTETLWVCPAGFHSRAVPDQLLWEVIEPLLTTLRRGRPGRRPMPDPGPQLLRRRLCRLHRVLLRDLTEKRTSRRGP